MTKYTKLVNDIIIPYKWYILNDRIEDAEPSYCLNNFRIATGKYKFLNIMKRFEDLICDNFGEKEKQIHGYSGHKEIELALVKLYEVIHCLIFNTDRRSFGVKTKLSPVPIKKTSIYK